MLFFKELVEVILGRWRQADSIQLHLYEIINICIKTRPALYL